VDVQATSRWKLDQLLLEDLWAADRDDHVDLRAAQPLEEVLRVDIVNRRAGDDSGAADG
jgi:hypothetical protein